MSLQETLHRKLLDDLSYWRKEYKLKQSVLATIERQFHKRLSAVVGKSEELQTAQQRHAQRLDEMVGNAPEPEAAPAEPTEPLVERREMPGELKQLYREIVKRTHPDKTLTVADEVRPKLHKIYISATQSYESYDAVGILLQAKRLRLPLPTEDAHYEPIRREVSELKGLSGFMESSMLWRWYHADAKERRRILHDYIQKELGG